LCNAVNSTLYKKSGENGTRYLRIVDKLKIIEKLETGLSVAKVVGKFGIEKQTVMWH
jgi:hypothetical protein